MDEIQRKLELIDKQLSRGFINSYRRVISASPLLIVATGLIAGILLQSKLSDLLGPGNETRFVWPWLILLALCSVSAVILFSLQKNPKDASYILALISTYALICFMSLGAIRLITFHQVGPNDIRNLINHEFTRINTKELKIKRLIAEDTNKKLEVDSRLRGNDKSEERQLATIRGLIITEPYTNKNRDWEFAKFTFTDPASSFYLKVKEVETTTGWAKATGTVRVQVAEPILDLKAGDYIQAYCWLDIFEPPTNPGQFDTARYLARKNVFLAASVQSRAGIELLESSGKGTFTKIKGKMREKAAQALLDSPSPEDPSQGLLEALLLGYRGNIDSETYRAFHKTGLLHFISLSGMHLGILAGTIWWLCKIAGLMKRGRAFVCIIVIATFLLIVPPRAPTVRAAVICFVFCISFFFRRRPNPLNTLSLAAIILLLIRPTNLFEAGWQLSFASVLGLLLFCERLNFFLYEKITGIPWFRKAPKTKWFFRIISRPGPYLLRLFSVGITAWLSGAGILLYHFYTINPLTSIWTVITFPLVTGILTFGFLKIILSFLLPSAAAALGLIVNGLSDLLILIVKLFAQVNISQILIGHISVALIILYYGFILFAFFVYFRNTLIKKVICTAMLLTIIIFLGATKWQRTHRDNLVLTALDVGHGQAILAQLPGRANVLFDAGSLHKSNVGKRIVAPFLDFSGINKINAIIISHNDIDHINGIPEITEHCEVSSVYANNEFFNQKDQWGTAKFLMESLNKKNLEIQSLGEGLYMHSNSRIKVVWPTRQIRVDENLGDNDKSAVCLIEFAGRKILLCSDIEKFAQKELLQHYPNLKADIVVVPHHGSAKTLEDGFLENFDANILICSCGRKAYERQQKNNESFDSTQDRYLTRNVELRKAVYTARNGAVTIYITKNGKIKLIIQAQ